MSIWDMDGAALSREIDQPAPVTVLRGGHNAGMAGIVASIAALPATEREELLRAIVAAMKPEPKRIGGSSFRTAEEFFPMFNAAREACQAAHGVDWYLEPSASLKARVPAAWVALRGEMGTWRSPRDVNFPRAEFWPGGVLPVGPEYAEHGPVARGEIRPASVRAIRFEMEHTPENIDNMEMAA